MAYVINTVLTALPFLAIGWLYAKGAAGEPAVPAKDIGLREIVASAAEMHLNAVLILFGVIGTLIALALGASFLGVIIGVAAGLALASWGRGRI